MRFLENIKERLNNPDKYRGINRNDISVNYKNLDALVSIFEELESERVAKQTYENKEMYSVEFVFARAMEAVCHKHKDTEIIFHIFTETIKPFINKNLENNKEYKRR